MVKKFDEFIKERYDYDDVPIGNHRNTPTVAVGEWGINKNYIDKDWIKNKELFYTDEKYGFNIYKIEGKHSNVWFIDLPKDDKTKYVKYYFKIDGEYDLEVPMGIGDVYIVRDRSRMSSGDVRIYLFNTETGELSKDKLCYD